jgi:glycosyltransferase involved in cell wall biosynthesis
MQFRFEELEHSPGVVLAGVTKSGISNDRARKPFRTRMKVLHVVESLDHGSVETWLVRMLRHARNRGIDLDWSFYCTLGRPGVKDDEVRALGAHVIHSPAPMREKLAFVRALREELRQKEYEVLHCHHDLVSAVYLVAALGMPVTKRVIHVHNADEVVPTPNRFKQSILRPLLRRGCLWMADSVVGNSNHSLDTFIGDRVRRKGVDVVNYLGVDSTPFESAKGDRFEFRRSLGIAEHSWILLFAGRMVPEKNPVFAVDVLAELVRFDPGAIGVFAGSGMLESAVRQRSEQLGLGDAVRYLGWRSDVADIMCCCDWFILPHPEQPVEGFGIAVVEAQLAGLRMLLSRGILDDPLLPTACFRRLSLADGPIAWAEAAMELRREPAPSRATAVAALRQSPMDMDRALERLLQLYA